LQNIQISIDFSENEKGGNEKLTKSSLCALLVGKRRLEIFPIAANELENLMRRVSPVIGPKSYNWV
jgi:hypothetical protein